MNHALSASPHIPTLQSYSFSSLPEKIFSRTLLLFSLFFVCGIFFVFSIWKIHIEIRKETKALLSLCVCVCVLVASVQFSSVAQSCLTLCNPMNCSMPGPPVHHQLPESTQTLVHRVSDAIQPSHPLLSPSPPALNPSQHQGLFQ